MTKPLITIQRLINLQGPNIWTYRPVIEAWVDLSALAPEARATASEPLAAILSWIPSLAQSFNNAEASRGLDAALARGDLAPNLFEHLALTLQALANMPGGFGETQATSEPGLYKVIVRAWHPIVTTRALQFTAQLIEAALAGRHFNASQAIKELDDLRHKHCLGPSTSCIVDAADDRDIPAIRLNTGNLLQLGYGMNQRRIWTAETDRTGAIAETISRDKDLTKSLLEACGVPIPVGQAVESALEAWEIAQELGLPVVVKPSDGNHGRGVFTNLSTQLEIEKAYAVAVQEGSGVLIERFIQGLEHRLLIVGGEMVAAARGEYACVTGNGEHTIETLVDSQLNADPRRGHEDDLPLNYIKLDSAARLELARQGFAPDTILPAGQQAVIQRNGNVAIDCTEEVHPDVAAVASTAARIVGLDIAGIDLVALDISKPLHTQGGAIVEVNAGPGLLMHLKPAVGQARQVGRNIVARTFANGDMARVPVIGITGTHGQPMIGKLLYRLLSLQGLRCGLASSRGLFVDTRQLHRGDCANFENARRVLMNREVQAAIIETGAQQILTEGLAYERCEVGIVSHIDWHADLTRYLISGQADHSKVYRTQIDVVLPGGMAVLNADDPHIADLAQHCDGQVTWVSLSDDSAIIGAHLRAGQRAVVVSQGRLSLAHGPQRHTLCPITSIASSQQGMQTTELYNILSAAAAAWALSVPPDLIEAGLLSFDPMTATPPGPF